MNPLRPRSWDAAGSAFSMYESLRTKAGGYASGLLPGVASQRILVVLVLVWLAVAFPVCAGAQRFQARLFDEADGLTSLSVASFAQTPDGDLWIGTVNGVFRYDGTRFTEFDRAAGLTDPSVYSLLVDHGGTLWAGSHHGLFRFDGQRFREVQADGKSLRVGVNSMLTSTAAGELIAETSLGIYSVERLEGAAEWKAMRYRQRHPSFPDSQDTDGIAVDAGDRLWFGDSSKLCSFSGGVVRVYGPEEGVPQDFYVSIFAAPDGRMWARGRKHIVTWHPGDAKITDMTGSFPPGAIVTVNRRFAADRRGHTFTPTAHGFATWDGHSWSETTATSAGPIEGATDLFADRENSIWIGTDGAGLLHSLGYGIWKNYSTESGLASPSVGSMASDDAGNIWLGNNAGVDILRHDTALIERSPLAGEPDAKFVQSLVPDGRGGMWAAGLLGGIFHVAAGARDAGHVDARYSIDAYIKRLILDPYGVLWIATNAGIFTLHCDTKPCHPERYEAGGLGKTDIGDFVAAPDGSLWVGSGRGLTHIQGKNVTSFALTVDKGAVQMLSVGNDGTMWLAPQSGGVTHVRVTGTTVQVLESYSRPQLTSDLISFLTMDRDGRLWVGTDAGLNVLSGGRFFHVTDEDGLIRNDTASRAFLMQQDGTLWFGTGLGASHVVRPDLLLGRAPFAVEIVDAQYARKPLAQNGAIAWSRGTPSFQFSAVTFHNNRKMRYHWQLEGFDGAETVGKEAEASYPQLPPGSYTFRVYAEDAGTGTISAPAELSFTLTPPWYRTLWARSLGALLVVGAIAGLWYVLHLALLAQRRKLRMMVEQRTQELEKQANHDALTGLLNRRALLAALLRELDDAHRSGGELCLAIIDLDHFKQINDTHGHLAGDEVLRQTALRLATSIRTLGSRKADIVGRYGGEEFLAIFRDTNGSMGIERCESIRKAVSAQPMQFEGTPIKVTCSIGLAWIGVPPEPLEALLGKADEALYLAKDKGRNLVQWIESKESAALLV